MKKLLLTLFCAVMCSISAAQVVVSPGCTLPGGVASGGGLPVNPCAVAVDPREMAIKAYWDKFAIYPSMTMDAMLAFGVDAYELEDAINYEVNIVQWLRYNKAPAALIKTWPDADIDQYLTWTGQSLTDKWARVYAQDALDLAARRKALYVAAGVPIPDSISPWEH